MAEAPDQSSEKDPKQDESKDEEKPSGIDGMQSIRMFLDKLSLGETKSESEKPEQILEEVSFQGMVDYIKSGKCKKIITMAGAGISTSAGIPDFRTPGSGLYDNLQKYNLPSPQAMFEINFFKENPEPFFHLAKELYPGLFKPTPCHYFLRLLAEKGLLLRHYTQNIDTLERVAGVPGDLIVEAHGTFHTAHCLECRKEYSQAWIKEIVFKDEIPRCTAEDCSGGLVKPDIVFFGEALPFRFFELSSQDFPQCDLLIIMGTSLVVQPFASLTGRVPETTPRLYINLEAVEECDPWMALLGMGHGFKFGGDDCYRDVFWQGTCDDGCQALAESVGWGAELTKIVTEEHQKIDLAKKEEDQKAAGTGSDKKTPPSKKEAATGSENKTTGTPSKKSDKDSNL